jgi:TRAP-type C4-dicarboxylate transport system substrate-binding protein
MAYNLVVGEPGKIMTEKCEADTGIKMLYYNLLGFRLISNSRNPIVKPEDLKGLKIRTQANPFHMALLEAFGASTTTMPFSELFTALQQKVVDGQENPIMNVRDSRFYEVQSYMTRTNHLYTFAGTGINADFYNSLEPSLRDIIDEAAATAQAATLRELQVAEITAYRNIGNNMMVRDLNSSEMQAFRDTAQPLLARFKSLQNSTYFSSMIDQIQSMR